MTARFAAFAAYARKWLITTGGLISIALAYGQLHGSAATVASAVLAFLTSVGVYKVPNVPASPKS